MQGTSSRQLIAMLGLALLVVIAYLGVADARSAADRLKITQGDLVEVDAKLSEIERYQTAPRVAALDIESPDQIVNRITAALKTAGLPENALLDQTPTEPSRIDRTDFKLRSITIKLKPATLRQILSVCDALRDEETGTVVRDLLLTEPKSNAGRGNRENWDATLTLTQMIFSPTSDE